LFLFLVIFGPSKWMNGSGTGCWSGGDRAIVMRGIMILLGTELIQHFFLGDCICWSVF